MKLLTASQLEAAVFSAIGIIFNKYSADLAESYPVIPSPENPAKLF